MAQKSGPPPIVYVLGLLLLSGLGFWFFRQNQNPNQQEVATPPDSTTASVSPGNSPAATPPTAPVAPGGSAFAPPTSVTPGTNVRIDGSTSMVTVNENLKKSFQSQFPGTTVATNARGTDSGIQALFGGGVDIAAISRPLTAQEQSQGLAAVPVTQDAIALIVGNTNPFSGGLTKDQVAGIFQGQLNNWSAVGGPALPIKVINRPGISGTHQAFKELVLNKGNFGTAPNITTLPRDETTGLIKALGKDGIGYATYAQAAKQSTVRVVPIDGVTPGAPNYPFQRQLYYAYKNPPSPAVQAFLGYATSPQGQQGLAAGN